MIALSSYQRESSFLRPQYPTAEFDDDLHTKKWTLERRTSFRHHRPYFQTAGQVARYFRHVPDEPRTERWSPTSVSKKEKCFLHKQKFIWLSLVVDCATLHTFAHLCKKSDCTERRSLAAAQTDKLSRKKRKSARLPAGFH